MQLYKKYLRLWKEGIACAGFSPRLPDYAIRYWLDQMEKALPAQSARSFLDIGAGDGRLSLLLLQAYSPAGMAIEVQVNKEAWRPITDRFGRFELKDGLLQDIFPELAGQKKFDFILLAEVFEHIPPPDVPLFLQQLQGVLADDGRIFLTTPNRVVQGPAEQSAVWHEREPYGHHKHYTLQELETLLNGVGLEIERVAFECHKLKNTLYNKMFYPASRLDARLLQSKKIPQAVRAAYRYASAPALAVAKMTFWSLAQLVYSVEKRWSNEQSAATMMLSIKKG